MEQPPKETEPNEIGRLLLDKIQFDQWWYKKDNVELPLYGEELLEDF